MNRWEIAILKSIESLGGEAKNQQIYKELLSFKKFLNMTEKHLRKSKHGRYPAYQDGVRSNLSNLRQAGELKRISRGQPYSLTEKGIKRIEIEKKKKTFMGGLNSRFLKDK